MPGYPHCRMPGVKGRRAIINESDGADRVPVTDRERLIDKEDYESRTTLLRNRRPQACKRSL